MTDETNTETETTDDESGPLVGTASEQAPGVGDASHPAPAAMVDDNGNLRQHGEPVNSAGNSAPVGDSVDEQSGGDVDPEAREKLNAETELEQVETDRPDLGTPTTED